MAENDINTIVFSLLFFVQLFNYKNWNKTVERLAYKLIFTFNTVEIFKKCINSPYSPSNILMGRENK